MRSLRVSLNGSFLYIHIYLSLKAVFSAPMKPRLYLWPCAHKNEEGGATATADPRGFRFLSFSVLRSMFDEAVCEHVRVT